MTAKRARDLIASEAVCRSAGISVIDNDDRRATLEMPVTAEMVTSLGFAHAGYVVMLADTASGCVALAIDPGAITTGADVSFLGPARLGDVLVATADLRARSGRSLLIDVAVTAGAEAPRRVAEFRARAHLRTPTPDAPTPDAVPRAARVEPPSHGSLVPD